MTRERGPLPLLLGLLRWLLDRGQLAREDVEEAVRCAARGSLGRGLAEHAPEVYEAMVEALCGKLPAKLLDETQRERWLQHEAHRWLSGDAALYVLGELCATDDATREHAIDCISWAVTEWTLSHRQGASLISYLAGNDGWHEESDRFMEVGPAEESDGGS